MTFDTSVLDAALAEKVRQYERERRQLLDNILELLDELGPEYGLQTAYIFGSLTRPGGFRADSDVDLTVELVDLSRFFELSGRLSAILQREIDLVILQECHFADKIRREGIKWTPSG